MDIDIYILLYIYVHKFNMHTYTILPFLTISTNHFFLPNLVFFPKPFYWPHKIQVTLLGTNISPIKALLKMIFLFPGWDMLIPWRVFISPRCGMNLPMPGLPSSAASFGVPIGAPTPRGRGPRNGRSGGHRSGGGAGARRDKDADQNLGGAFSWPKQKRGDEDERGYLGCSKVGGELIGMVVGSEGGISTLVPLEGIQDLFKIKTRWWQLKYFLFSPLLTWGKMISILRLHNFQRGWLVETTN